MRLSVLVAAALLAASLAAHADTITSYSSQTAFDAASTTTTYTIPTVTPPYVQVSNPYTLGPVTFSNTTGTLFLDNDGSYGAGQTYFNMLGKAGYADKLTFSSATAIGLEIATYQAASTLTFDVDGSVFNFNTPAGDTPIFIGFTSTTPITSLSVTDTTGETDILDFQLGSAGATSVTPEPSSILLLGTGLLGVLGVVRRRLA